MKPLILLTLTFSVLFGTLAPFTPAVQAQEYDSFYEDGGPTIVDGELTSGGFVPCSGNKCSLCDFAVLANTIIKWLIGILFLFFAILAVYAGFRLVTSGGNPGAKQAAKSSFTNAFIGLFIVLGAWILIDTLLRALLAGGGGEISGYGPWSQIQCATQVAAGIELLAISDPDLVTNAVAIMNNPGNCQPDPSGPCSVAGLTPAFGSLAGDAATILGAESGCNPNAESSTDRTSDGRAYSIGLWQINLSAHPITCNGRTLQCPTAFRDTGTRNKYNIRIQQVVNETLYQQCVAAAKDPSCNSAKAAQLVQAASGFGDWACSAKKCGVYTSRNSSCRLRL